VSNRVNTAKLARVVALLDSPVDAEALAAARAASRLLKQAGMTWGDLLAESQQQFSKQLAIATEACAGLVAQNQALESELEHLRSTSTPWSPVGAVVSDTRRAAKWALELHDTGQIWLSSEFEVGFLQTCSKWKGRLTPNQQPIFQKIMDRVVRQTGQTPPA
jgi:hypothetical protein